jgi:hypothetical protein
MGIGLETLFHLVYELVHWIVSWVVPQYGVVEAHELGVKVTGPKVSELAPGGYWQHRQRTTVYTANVKRVVREPADVIATTTDGTSVRVGISLAFTISNVKTWLIENEDAEQGLLIDAQRVVLKYVRTHTFNEIQNHDEDETTRLAQRELGRYFGVQIKQLGITTFVETECRDLNHSGVVPGIGASEEDEDE